MCNIQQDYINWLYAPNSTANKGKPYKKSGTQESDIRAVSRTLHEGDEMYIYNNYTKKDVDKLIDEIIASPEKPIKLQADGTDGGRIGDYIPSLKVYSRFLNDYRRYPKKRFCIINFLKNCFKKLRKE